MSAESSLELGNEYPYDEESEIENPDWAHKAARGVLNDLGGRGGVGNELDSVDSETRLEIVESVAEIIRLAHAQSL
jgi:hypothetical protein